MNGNLQQRDSTQAVRLYEQGAKTGTGKPVMGSNRRWRVSWGAVASLALGSCVGFMTPLEPTHATVTAQATSCSVTHAGSTCTIDADTLWIECLPSSCPRFLPDASDTWAPTGIHTASCTPHPSGDSVNSGFLLTYQSCNYSTHDADGTYYYAMKNLATSKLGWFEIVISGNTATVTKTAYDDTVNPSIKVGYADTPTFVSIVDFDCHTTPSSTECQWSVGQELSANGYNLWRLNQSTWVPVNPALVPATGDGSSYAVTDTLGGNDKGFTYRLEESDQNGGSTFYAPDGSDTPTDAPLRVIGNSPSNADTLSAATPPTFAWAADNATTFNLQFAISDTRTIYNVYPSSGTTSTRYTPKAEVWEAFAALTSGQTIYWRIVMQHTNGKVFYTPVRHLTVSP